ncbi:alpha/beta hydrolase [Tissierella sp. MSJ-40]|uniref:Alpha/beta hydrolase n=1 Tax=Tissierella simiarum TaxID=2841534 RepID=A0ABS6E3H7_9FIRM|nr:alpha/beta hydrolase [Tissierella simiarum]MBU5437329.1 alpha/beta hydrolase [Tissierella simiarum]
MGNTEIDNENVINKEEIYENRPKRKSKIKKIIAWLLISLFILSIIAFSLLPPIMINKMVNMHVDFKETYAAEEFGISSEHLTLKTEDGLNIAAYEVYKETPKAVIIFISGIHNPSVTAFFGHAKMLQENGYASILYEMRAHGESDGDVIGLGFKEHLDTKAVVDYIKSNERYKDVPIVVYGLSMGAAVAINSIGKIDEIDGLISMSSYSSFEDVFCDNMINSEAPKIITQIQKPFIKMYTTFKYGFDSFNINPKNEIKNLGKRPALIMHSTDDTQVPFSSFERIIKNAPGHVETWVREGDLHFIVQDYNMENPESDKEYTEVILTFLNNYFSN